MKTFILFGAILVGGLFAQALISTGDVTYVGEPWCAPSPDGPHCHRGIAR